MLIFTIGLEFEFRQISNIRNFFIALIGILVPWVVGFFVARLFNFDFKASLLIGTALTATSIAITANVLKEMGKLQTDVGEAIIGAAIIDDVLALLVLTFSEGIVTGNLSALTILFTMLKAAAFIVLAIAFGRLVLNKLLIKIDQTTIAGKFPEIIFIFAMMIAFLYGVIAQIAGLSAIVGAFLAGISFTGVGLKHSKSFKDGAEYLQVIFASVFFISLGILLDIHTLTWGLAVFIVVLTLVASLSKVIGCGLPAKLYGFSWKDSLAVGVGMVPRGEVAMIVALLGLTQNLISNRAYSALVLMSLFTTIITPVIFRNFLFRNGVKTVR